MIPISDRQKLNNILHIRTSDEFMDNLRKITEKYKEAYGEEIKLSEAARRLLFHRMALIIRNFTLDEVFQILARNFGVCDALKNTKIPENAENMYDVLTSPELKEILKEKELDELLNLLYKKIFESEY